MSEEKYKCGSCLHFKQHAHPSQGSVCSTLGVKHYNIAPRCFTPDVSQLVESNEDLANIAVVFASLNARQRTIFRAILKTNTAKRPFNIGQKLYMKAVGGDYVSNYLSGYVMGYTSTKQIILSGSPDARTRGRLFLAYLDAADVMLPSEWQKKKAALVKAGRIADPKKPLTKRKNIDIDYEPPTMDKAPKEWRDASDRKKHKVNRSDETVKDLTIHLSGERS